MSWIDGDSAKPGVVGGQVLLACDSGAPISAGVQLASTWLSTAWRLAAGGPGGSGHVGTPQGENRTSGARKNWMGSSTGGASRKWRQTGTRWLPLAPVFCLDSCYSYLSLGLA